MHTYLFMTTNKENSPAYCFGSFGSNPQIKFFGQSEVGPDEMFKQQFLKAVLESEDDKFTLFNCDDEEGEELLDYDLVRAYDINVEPQLSKTDNTIYFDGSDDVNSVYILLILS